nr:hypothetical protein [Tanacetum cinerariifolium]
MELHVDDSIKNWVTDHVSQATNELNQKIDAVNTSLNGILSQMHFLVNDVNRFRGGEGTSTTRFSRLGKLKFPKFHGDDVKGWMFRVKQFFFAIDNVHEEDMIKMVSIQLYDKALAWHLQFVKAHGDTVMWNVYEERPSMFDDDQFEDELEMGDDAFVLLGKEPLCDIQHHIDLEPSSQFPNRPHYRLRPGEHEELRRQVEEFISKGHIRKIMSMCAQPRGPLDLMSLHVSGSVPKKVQDFVEGFPCHGDSSDDDVVGNSRTNFVYP